MMTVLIATIKRNYRIIKRAYPFSFIFGRLVMGAYTVFFAFFVYKYMFHGILGSDFKRYTGSSDYLTYAVLGAAFHVFAAAILMNVGRSLTTELREGTLETLLLSPATRKGYFLGSLVEQIGRSSLELVVIMAVGYFLGIKVVRLQFDQLILVWLLSLISFFSMSVALAAFMLYIRDTYISQNTLFMVMGFLCGVSFPVQYLPLWLQPFSHLFPLTPALQLFRDVLMLGHSISQHFPLVWEQVGLSLFYLLMGSWWLVKSERKFIEKSFG